MNADKETRDLECGVNIPGRSTLDSDTGLNKKLWFSLVGLVMSLKCKVQCFVQLIWKLGVDDPRKVIHGIKVGIALVIVSLFYYTRPLYDGVGGASMWAVMTVVVVFEFTVGGTLYKGINRGVATFTAGLLAIGIHWIASKAGEPMETIVRTISVFVLASVATFSRFIPTVKTWFDYGITIFILTFSLVAVSGYRVDKLIELATQRLSTIAIGIAICLLVSFFVFPVWAGSDLHLLITRNLDKLADSLEGCMDAYFTDDQVIDLKEGKAEKAEGYKCALNSKASEDSLANLAKWEPAHGNFSFRHPWSKYQKIGAAMRQCAYCIETLSACLTLNIRAPQSLKKQVGEICIRLSLECANVLKESSRSIKFMEKSRNMNILIDEMNTTSEELSSFLAQSTTNNIRIEEASSLISAALLLVEIAKRVRGVVENVDKLATAASFNEVDVEKPVKVEV